MAKRGSLDQDRIVRIQEFTTRDCLEIVKRSADILHVEESRQGKLDSHLAGRPSTLSATYDTSIKMVPSCPNYEKNSISVKENYTKDSLFPIGQEETLCHRALKLERIKSSSNLRFESELINIIISPDFSYDFYALIHSMIKHGINKVDKNFI